MIDLGGDTTGGVSKLVFTILSAVAEPERDCARERITGVKRDQRQRGRFLGSRRLAGVVEGNGRNAKLVPEKQRAIRKIRRLRAEGISSWRISERMIYSGQDIGYRGQT
jgi:DNA invertase Pin-like site-specific DNA recombinase